MWINIGHCDSTYAHSSYGRKFELANYYNYCYVVILLLLYCFHLVLDEECHTPHLTNNIKTGKLDWLQMQIGTVKLTGLQGI
jgi:hypothetical protein